MEIIFLLDTSNSMSGERINQLNHAMFDVLNNIEYITSKNDDVSNVRVISFNNVAKFVVGNANEGVPVYSACETWTNLVSKGATDTAHAIRLCKKSIECDYSNSNFNETIVVLVTDGQCDSKEDFQDAMSEIKMSILKMKNKSIYFTAIGVCDYDALELKEFVSLNDISTMNGLSKDSVHTIDDIGCLNDVIEKALSYN